MGSLRFIKNGNGEMFIVDDDNESYAFEVTKTCGDGVCTITIQYFGPEGSRAVSFGYNESDKKLLEREDAQRNARRSLGYRGEMVCTVNGIRGSVMVLSLCKNATIDNAMTLSEPRLNMPLREYDIIFTLPESEIRLEIAEQSRTETLLENNMLIVSDLKDMAVMADIVPDAGRQVNFRLGGNNTIIRNIKKILNSQSDFEHETPTAVAGIRG